jgi:sec-independent protein translocase protein TatB
VFGISFSEIILIALIALVVVGPQKLPAMLLSIGRGIAKVRRITADVRTQTGIDEILREEGIDGVRELRSLLRGEVAAARARGQDVHDDAVELDENQEYPPEGADSGGALSDDLVDRKDVTAAPSAPPDAAEANAAPADESPRIDKTVLDGRVSVSTDGAEANEPAPSHAATRSETATSESAPSEAQDEPRKEGGA